MVLGVAVLEVLANGAPRAVAQEHECSELLAFTAELACTREEVMPAFAALLGAKTARGWPPTVLCASSASR